jgi:hypothetical protein
MYTLVLENIHTREVVLRFEIDRDIAALRAMSTLCDQVGASRPHISISTTAQ